MKTTTIGAYPKPSYLKIPDWFQNIDNTPIDWDRAWKLLGNQKDKLIKLNCSAYAKFKILTNPEPKSLETFSFKIFYQLFLLVALFY